MMTNNFRATTMDLLLTGVGVEKLLSAKITKMKLRYDAPQSTFGIRLGSL